MKKVIAFLLTATSSTAVFAIGQSTQTNSSNGSLAIVSFFAVWAAILMFTLPIVKGKIQRAN
jgi:hypothetical protein